MDAMEIVDRIVYDLVGLAFKLDWLFPPFIRLFLDRKLKEYKEKGIISDYEVRAGRKEKFHYVIQVDLFLERLGGEE